MLKGKLVNLRLVMDNDLDQIYDLISDVSQMGEYWPVSLRTKVGYKKTFSETGFWTNDFGTMLISDKKERIVGEIGFFKGVWYLPGYEVGYRIYQNEDRGKGYTTEALKLFSSYLFEDKNINRLEIQVSTLNVASRKVAEKCGYKFEGLKRQAVLIRGKYEDLNLLALLKEDCPSLKEALSD